MERPATSNIALYVDFENFGATEFLEEDFDIGVVINKLKERGRLIVKKAYADWGRFRGVKRDFLENSVELIEMPSYGRRRKNSSDIKLAVEAMEDALHKHHIDTFVIVSGDSDFTPLIAKLREFNKYVIVIAEKENVSPLIKGFCDELMFYSALTGESEYDPEDLEKTLDLLKRALTRLGQENRPATASSLKVLMRQIEPAFDEENFGFNQFKKYLQHWQERGAIALSFDSGEIVVSETNSKAASEAPPIPPAPAVVTPTSQVLARLRHHRMQFLGIELRERIITGLFNLMTAEGRVKRWEISERLAQKFRSDIDAGRLSKNKIGSIVKIPFSAGAFATEREMDEVYCTLRPEFSSSAQEMIDLYDNFIYFVAGKIGVAASEIDGLLEVESTKLRHDLQSHIGQFGNHALWVTPSDPAGSDGQPGPRVP